MSATGRVSLNPATFVQGGLIDDIDATIMRAAFCYWDYDKGGDTYLFLGMVLQDKDGKEHAQYYSAGDKEFFEPGDAQGTWLRAKGARSSMNTNTNAAAFLQSLVAAGFPQDRLDTMGIGDALTGLKAHWNQVAQPKRKGLIKTGAAVGEQEREKSTLLVSAILQLPGQVAAGTGMGMGRPVQPPQLPAPPPPTPPPFGGMGQAPTPLTQAQAPVPATNGGNAELDGEAMIGLMEILMEGGGTVNKAQLPGLAFKKFMSHPNKGKLVPRIYSQEFLTTAPGISFDGATVKMQ